MYGRIELFESAIGDLELILGNEIESLTQNLFEVSRTPEEEAAFIQQAAENILRRKAQQEEFDEESQGLLGQDDIFVEQLDRIRQARRYISPDEVRDLVEADLTERVPSE